MTDQDCVELWSFEPIMLILQIYYEQHTNYIIRIDYLIDNYSEMIQENYILKVKVNQEYRIKYIIKILKFNEYE